MAAILLADYLNKRTAPYLIWTVVALACALCFWLARPSAAKSGAGARASGAGRSSGRQRRPTISVALDGLVLSAGAAAEAAGRFLDLCAAAEVFVLALAGDDAREEEVKAALEAMGAFEAGLRRHRVMFSSTLEGRASMVRQLQPAVHLEAEESVASALQGKVPEVRLVGSPAWPGFGDAADLAVPAGKARSG